MEGTYDVLLGNQKMGSATLTVQGLYLQIACKCPLSGDVMYDLILSIDDQKHKLGLLIPEDGSFTIRKKIPAKQIGQGRLQFTLKARHASIMGQFFPVKPDEPFAYINRIENAYVASRDGELGLILSEGISRQI